MVWRRMVLDQVFVVRSDGIPWQFASGSEAEVKADADRLSELSRGMILAAMGTHPCVQRADLLVGVPNGMMLDAEELAGTFNKNNAVLVRPSGAGRHEYTWEDDDQADIVANAEFACVLEDITTTGSSADATARYLRKINRRLRIHTISMLLRNTIDPAYIIGSGSWGAAIEEFHILCARRIPTEKARFIEEMGFEPAVVQV